MQYVLNVAKINTRFPVTSLQKWWHGTRLKGVSVKVAMEAGTKRKRSKMQQNDNRQARTLGKKTTLGEGDIYLL